MHQVCFTRYHVSFYLWLIQSVSKHFNVPKYYDQDCRLRGRKVLRYFLTGCRTLGSLNITYLEKSSSNIKNGEYLKLSCRLFAWKSSVVYCYDFRIFTKKQLRQIWISVKKDNKLSKKAQSNFFPLGNIKIGQNGT